MVSPQGLSPGFSHAFRDLLTLLIKRARDQTPDNGFPPGSDPGLEKEPVMDTKADNLDPEMHRRLGADLFNKTWTLMKKADRTREDDDEMLHCAHASAYHWLHVGTAANRARSEWQCSRMY